MSEQTGNDPIRVRTVTVRTGRIIFDIELPNPAHRYSSPKLAAFVTTQYPNLLEHACVNGTDDVFGAVVESTSVPHILEHLTIDVQTRDAREADATFVGTTEWLDEDQGLARIEMSFRDDLHALRAFAEATRFLNTAVLTCTS